MAPLKYGNNRNNYNRDITYRQSIGKQISYRPYKEFSWLSRFLKSFNGYFDKVDFLDWLLDLEDLLDYENICDEKKVKLALYKLRKYALGRWERIQTDRIK